MKQGTGFQRALQRTGGVCLVLFSIGIAGCPGTPIVPDGGNPPPNGSVNTSEPNDTFAQAAGLSVAPGGITFEGSISTPSDVDVFNLGPVSVGDRIMVFVNGTSASLDPALALFDESERLIIENDDIDLGINLASQVDERLRRSASPLLLAITSSQFGATSGNYTATIAIERGVGISGTASQVIFLNFAGGNPGVSDPQELSGFISPFDAEAIDSAYRGKGDEIIDAVAAAVSQNFSRYNVTMFVRRPGEPPLNVGPAAQVFIGGFNGELFGIAEDVDVFNADPADAAVVFSQSFTSEVFNVTPSPSNLGLAIGNIAAHEAGHLMGLNHVGDALALMDTGSPPSSFLLDQEFINAPLHSSIFPIGSQDAHLLLLETLGASGAANAKSTPVAARQWLESTDVETISGAPASTITKADMVFCFCHRCAARRIKTEAWQQYYGQ